jgi:DNA-cytosine methyltransferase
MNVLSLFDGMSCGQIALSSLGIKYDNYYSSEIDECAIKVTQHNFPDTIQLGDINNIKGSDLPKIDLVFGGSPCQSFSRAGDGSGFDGKSKLFWEFVRVLKETKPKYFLLENVKMKKEWKDVISQELGVEPIKINSNLVSAQNRERLYWTNIPGIVLPENKNIFIDDILDEVVDQKYFLKERNLTLLKNKVSIDGFTPPLCIDIYNKKVKLDRKSPTLTHPCHNSIRLLIGDNVVRKFTPSESEKLQTVPVGYTNVGLADIHRYTMLGNGWTVDVIKHIFKNII